mmetsp:Transcript_116925/g.330846  ORF Transcript_116925/g.330846 Transcript_116925/m.330846 type:complete len:123 (-) Transcript_116925:2-370(-)
MRATLGLVGSGGGRSEGQLFLITLNRRCCLALATAAAAPSATPALLQESKAQAKTQVSPAMHCEPYWAMVRACLPLSADIQRALCPALPTPAWLCDQQAASPAARTVGEKEAMPMVDGGEKP